MSLFAGQPAQSAPLDPLVSADDFAEFFSLGGGNSLNLSPLEQSRIQTALEISSATIRNGRRMFDLVSSEQVYVDGTGRPSFTTPYDRLPVTSITNIQELRFLATDYVTVDATTYDWDEFGVVTLNGRAYPTWTPRRRGLIVTLGHGYATLPREVAGICLSYAKRLYDSPDGAPILMERLGDYQVQFEAGGGLLAPEKEILAQYEVPQWP